MQTPLCDPDLLPEVEVPPVTAKQAWSARRGSPRRVRVPAQPARGTTVQRADPLSTAVGSKEPIQVQLGRQ